MKLAVALFLVVVCVAFNQGFLLGSEKNVQYKLFTRNQADKLLSNSYKLFSDSGDYKASRKTYFIIHGWNGGNFVKSWGKDIKDALLKREDCNVIFVDWSQWATNTNYLVAKSKCRDAGKELSTFIERLENTFKASRTLMHLIGHSLGGQVAGFAGENLQNPTKIARITGLDTSGIAFNCLLDDRDCLDPSDAEFVDEIHTLVSAIPRGHADFYPVPTDIRKTLFETKLVGAHDLAAEYFVTSIESGPCAFKATQCTSYQTYKAGSCSGNEVNSLGFFARKPSKRARSVYFITIDPMKPC